MTEFKYTAEQTALIPKLESANINPVTFLATDYLNHFNEIVMLLEMVPDMPELTEDACGWQPKSYPDHFRDSGFQAKDLAIEAYKKAPAAIRQSFEQTTQSLDSMIIGTLEGLTRVGAAERGLTADAQVLVHKRLDQIREQLMVLNGVIHGRIADEVTAIEAPAASETDAQSQADIDKLFD